MLRHDLRRALLSPRTLFVALVYGVLLSLGATETWNDSAAYQFAFSYKTGFYILFYLCAVLPYGCGYLEDRLSGYWRGSWASPSFWTRWVWARPASAERPPGRCWMRFPLV